jgi:hypothetical protein
MDDIKIGVGGETRQATDARSGFNEADCRLAAAQKIIRELEAKIKLLQQARQKHTHTHMRRSSQRPLGVLWSSLLTNASVFPATARSSC